LVGWRSPLTAGKGLSKVLAENKLLHHEVETVRASQELDRVARSKRQTRLPKGDVMMTPSNLLQSQLHMCLYVVKAQEFHLGYYDLL